MSRLLITILISSQCGISMAGDGWLRLATNDQGTSYADAQTTQRDGPKVKLWVVEDFKHSVRITGGFTVSSVKKQVEMDCRENTSRTLFYSAHVNHMGEGRVVKSESTPMAWSPVPPNTVGTLLLEALCFPEQKKS